MGTRILINAQPLETRVAFLQGEVLVDFELEREQKIVGSIYKGRVVNVLPGMDAAFLHLGLSRNAFIYVDDVDPAAKQEREAGSHRTRYASIRDALTPGEELLVQVVRPPVGSKGARVTTRLTLQGRVSVLMVASPHRLGVSRRIEDNSEEKRLRRLAEQLRPLDHGLILRTEAENCSEAEIRHDVQALVDQWVSLRNQAAEEPAPLRLHQELSLAARVVRDRLADDVEEVLIDSPEEFEQCRQLAANSKPELQSRLKLQAPPPPLFDVHGVEAQVSQALARQVALPSGGQLTLDETEAMTTIDVDTASFVGSTKLSETVLKTNLEAVIECARQIRLRDLGGVIIIDFIDMDRARDRIRVMDALEAELQQDRMAPRIVHLSPLGLVELSRRRRGLSLSQMVRVTCPCCAGLGEVSSPTSVAAEARRELQRRTAHCEAALLSVHPEVAAALVGDEGEVAQELEQELGLRLFVTAAEHAHPAQLLIDTGSLDQITQRHVSLPVGEVVEVSLRDHEVVPHGHPRFAAKAPSLVLLPNLIGHEEDSLKLRITEAGRWFCRAEIVPV